GRFAGARDAAEKAIHLAPQPHGAGLLADALVRIGEPERLTEVLQRWHEHPVVLFRYHLARGDIERAADYYESAIDQRAPAAIMMATWSLGASLRASHRWPGLARKMRLN